MLVWDLGTVLRASLDAARATAAADGKQGAGVPQIAPIADLQLHSAGLNALACSPLEPLEKLGTESVSVESKRDAAGAAATHALTVVTGSDDESLCVVRFTLARSETKVWAHLDVTILGQL